LKPVLTCLFYAAHSAVFEVGPYWPDSPIFFTRSTIVFLAVSSNLWAASILAGQ
jgi:hypothetical protein